MPKPSPPSSSFTKPTLTFPWWPPIARKLRSASPSRRMRLPFKLDVLKSWWLWNGPGALSSVTPGHQARLWQVFQAKVLTRSPLYRDRAPAALDAFRAAEGGIGVTSTTSTHGLALKDAMQVAGLETSCDFEPTIQGITVGLSSGTSGNRGLFLPTKSAPSGWRPCCNAFGLVVRSEKLHFSSGPQQPVQFRAIQPVELRVLRFAQTGSGTPRANPAGPTGHCRGTAQPWSDCRGPKHRLHPPPAHAHVLCG